MPALSEWIRRFAMRDALMEDRVYLKHYRKHTRQRRGIARNQRLDFFTRHRCKPARQTIDDPIEGLVLNRLELIATALKDQTFRSLLLQFIEKRLHQSALSHSG